MKIIKNPYLLITLAVVFGYWQVTFLKYSLRWDMLDVHLPFLYYLSECLKINEFPFWNPYQQLGYPFYADLQGTPYYLPALIVAKISGFNLYTLHFYFLAHIILAGCGLYRLCKSLFQSEYSSLLCGVCYSLSGIFISNGQHLLIITAAAYLPWLFAQFIYLLKFPTAFNSVLFGLLLFLMLSGGYPFISIIFFGLIVVLFSAIALNMIYEKNYRKLFTFAKLNFLALLIVVLLSLPLLISLFEVLPEVSRGAGIPVENSLENSYTFRAFMFSLLPFSLVKDSSFWGTDLSMTNIYFGLLPFCFLIYSIIQKKEKAEYFFLIAGICCLLISFGQELPLRKWLYLYIPLMDYFRFPALFRIFSVAFFLVVAGFGLNKFLNSPSAAGKKKMLIVSGVLSLYFFAHLIIAASSMDFSSLFLFKTHESVKEMLDSSALPERAVVQVIIQLFFIAVFTFLILRKKQQYVKQNILLLIVADMFVAAQLNVNFTVVEPQLKPSEIYEGIKRQPQGFPVPERKTFANAMDERIGVAGIWRNVNIFSKEPAVDAFSSFCLNNYSWLMEQSPVLAAEVLKNQPAYLSSTVISENDSAVKMSADSITSDHLFVSYADYLKLKNTPLVSSPGDTCYFETFGPNEFILSVKTVHAQILTLLQNNYKGWAVSIDSQPAHHFTSNLMFVSTIVPGGKHRVVFKQENKIVFKAFIFSSFFFIVVLVSLPFLKFRKL